MTPPPEPKPERHLVLSFQTRLNLTLLAAAIIPLGIFGVLLLVSGAVNPELGERLLLFMFAIAVVVGVLGGSVVGSNLVAPFREISGAVSRVSAGDMSQPIPVVGDDVLAQLAESHNRLASDADRRNRTLGAQGGPSYSEADNRRGRRRSRRGARPSRGLAPQTGLECPRP